MSKKNYRFEKLENLYTDAWYKKLMAKLKDDNIEMILDFISKNKELSKDEFEHKVNRMFLETDLLKDISKAKYNRLRIVQEVLATIA